VPFRPWDSCGDRPPCRGAVGFCGARKRPLTYLTNRLRHPGTPTSGAGDYSPMTQSYRVSRQAGGSSAPNAEYLRLALRPSRPHLCSDVPVLAPPCNPNDAVVPTAVDRGPLTASGQVHPRRSGMLEPHCAPLAGLTKPISTTLLASLVRRSGPSETRNFWYSLRRCCLTAASVTTRSMAIS
jgi:hypothetical protein